MGHPFAKHRQTAVEHSRVGHITHGYKSGGAVKHADAAEDRKLIRSMVKKTDLKAEGDKSKHRMDRPKRAHGGKVGKKHGSGKTIINVITGGDKAAPPPMPMPPPGVGPAAMPPPGPPMGAKPPMMPPPGAGGPPTGMPMRKSGGRVKRADGGPAEKPRNLRYGWQRDTQPSGITVETPNWGHAKDTDTKERAKGGRVQTPAGSGVAPNTKDAERNKGSKVFNQSMRNGTQISHEPGKSDLKDLDRGKAVTFRSGGRVRHFYAKGGKVESPQGVAKATMLPGGSGGGEARLAKEHRAERKG